MRYITSNFFDALANLVYYYYSRFLLSYEYAALFPLKHNNSAVKLLWAAVHMHTT